MNAVKSMVIGSLLLCGVAANAATLTFDEITSTNAVGGPYESSGFRISGTTLYGIASDYSPFFTSGALFDNAPGATITLEKIDGSAFSFNSIDITRFPGYDSTTPIDMLAFDSVGTQIGSLSFVVPNSTAFSTYSIGFSNVHKVTWVQAFAYHAFDNVVLDSTSAVPEPATLALVGLALAGIGATRRKSVAA